MAVRHPYPGKPLKPGSRDPSRSPLEAVTSCCDSSS
jgi:hypothetical protein